MAKPVVKRTFDLLMTLALLLLMSYSLIGEAAQIILSNYITEARGER